MERDIREDLGRRMGMNFIKAHYIPGCGSQKIKRKLKNKAILLPQVIAIKEFCKPSEVRMEEYIRFCFTVLARESPGSQLDFELLASRTQTQHDSGN